MAIPKIPDRFFCPINLDIMFDPVLAVDGRNYERIAIERHFNRDNTSPITGQFIGNTLVGNLDLRAEILEFLDVNAHHIYEAIEVTTPQNNYEYFIKALIKRNRINLDRPKNTGPDEGQTPLHIAIIHQKLDIIKLLLKKGANYKIRNKQHQTPKKLAKVLEFWDIVDLIDNSTDLRARISTSEQQNRELRTQLNTMERQNKDLDEEIAKLTIKIQEFNIFNQQPVPSVANPENAETQERLATHHQSIMNTLKDGLPGFSIAAGLIVANSTGSLPVAAGALLFSGGLMTRCLQQAKQFENLHRSGREVRANNSQESVLATPTRQYFQFFSKQAIELLAVGAGVTALGVAVHAQRKLDEQNKIFDNHVHEFRTWGDKTAGDWAYALKATSKPKLKSTGASWIP